MPRRPRTFTPDPGAVHRYIHTHLTSLADRRRDLDAELTDAVRHAHEVGVTWDAIGAALGIPGGSAWWIANRGHARNTDTEPTSVANYKPEITSQAVESENRQKDSAPGAWTRSTGA